MWPGVMRSRPTIRDRSFITGGGGITKRSTRGVGVGAGQVLQKGLGERGRTSFSHAEGGGGGTTVLG